MGRKGIASKADGPIVSGRKSTSPTGAGGLTRKKVSGHSGLTSTGGMGTLRDGKSMPIARGAKLVRSGKAPGLTASKPRVGTTGTSPGPMSKAFSGPDKGKALNAKGAMPTNVWKPR